MEEDAATSVATIPLAYATTRNGLSVRSAETEESPRIKRMRLVSADGGHELTTSESVGTVRRVGTPRKCTSRR